MIKTLPEEVEAYRDRMWRREPEARVETAVEAEKFVEAVGFCATMTDARRPGPSLYVAVCGRRDAHMPRNVQKDPESSATWLLKDELMRRGRVYYAKLTKGRAMFVAPRLVPHFNALWGVARRDEARSLSADARAILHGFREGRRAEALRACLPRPRTAHGIFSASDPLPFFCRLTGLKAEPGSLPPAG